MMYPVNQLVWETLHRQRLGRNELLERLGIRCTSGARRQLERLFQEDLLADQALYREFGRVMPIPEEALEAAIRLTDAQVWAQAVLSEVFQQDHARLHFQPHLRLEHDRPFPTPIFAAAMIGPDQLKRVSLPEGFDELSPLRQAHLARAVIRRHFAESAGRTILCGHITGYQLWVDIDRGFRFSPDGRLLGRADSPENHPMAAISFRHHLLQAALPNPAAARWTDPRPGSRRAPGPEWGRQAPFAPVPVRLVYASSFGGSGLELPANLLRRLFGPDQVLAPDLPLEPDVALAQFLAVAEQAVQGRARKRIRLVLAGTGLGSVYARHAAAALGAPALLFGARLDPAGPGPLRPGAYPNRYSRRLFTWTPAMASAAEELVKTLPQDHSGGLAVVSLNGRAPAGEAAWPAGTILMHLPGLDGHDGALARWVMNLAAFVRGHA